MHALTMLHLHIWYKIADFHDSLLGTGKECPLSASPAFRMEAIWLPDQTPRCDFGGCGSAALLALMGKWKVRNVSSCVEHCLHSVWSARYRSDQYLKWTDGPKFITALSFFVVVVVDTVDVVCWIIADPLVIVCEYDILTKSFSIQ